MTKVIVAYVPVLHRGYYDFFLKHSEAGALYVMSRDLILEIESLVKDIRALDPELVCGALRAWPLPIPAIEIASKAAFRELKDLHAVVVMPDEDISHKVSELYLKDCELIFDSVFLRWDRRRTLEEQEVCADQTISCDGLVQTMMDLALKESLKASNWWRQVGAVIKKGDEILLFGYNRHVPDSYAPYFEGDPRSNFKRGLKIEFSTDHHAEARLISEAARRGLALHGSDLFVTTFPCPPCAKLVAYSGIRRCYFLEGYAMLDGERILKDNGVEIIRVIKDPAS